MCARALLRGGACSLGLPGNSDCEWQGLPHVARLIRRDWRRQRRHCLGYVISDWLMKRSTW
eukprot:13760123-Alexandrium_andersonii.AAC.1